MNKSTQICPQTAVLQNWLRDSSTESIEKHVASCQVCQERLMELTNEPSLKGNFQPFRDVWKFHLEPQYQKLRRRMLSIRSELAVANNEVFEAFKLDLIPTGLETPDLQQEKEDTVCQPDATNCQQRLDQNLPTEILEEFQIEKLLGRGGFSQVFLAWDKSLSRQVAIKVLDVNQLDARNRQRFFREAKTAAQLNDPAIVPVYRIDETSLGQPYLVMQFIEGGTLEQETSTQFQASSIDNRAIDNSVRWIRDIARGLAKVHQAEMVHRDIKPTNILLDRSQDPPIAKLSDFGLVKHNRGESITLTRAAELVGTPAFMSPEQAQENAKVDERSDVYSLGATLYHSITGQPPFSGSSIAILRQITDVEPVSPRQLNEKVSRDLETICLRALSKVPERRYQSALDFADDLDRLVQCQPILARPVSGFERLGLWSQRNRLTATAVLLLAISMLTGTVISIAMWSHSERNAILANQRASELRIRSQQLSETAEKLESRNQDLKSALNSFFKRAIGSESFRMQLPAKFRNDIAREMRTYYGTYLVDNPKDIEAIIEIGSLNVELMKYFYLSGMDVQTAKVAKWNIDHLDPILDQGTEDVRIMKLAIESRLAIVQMRQQRPKAAPQIGSSLKDSIQILNKAKSLDFGADTRRLDILTSALETVENSIGEPEAAKLRLKTLIGDADQLASEFPKDIEIKDVQCRLRRMLGKQSSHTESAELREQSISILKDQLRICLQFDEPTFLPRRNIPVNRTWQAVSLMRANKLDSAQQKLEQAIEEFRQLIQDEPSFLQTRGDLAEALNILAEMKWHQSDREAASAFYDQAVDEFRKLIAMDPDQNQSIIRVVQIYSLLARRYSNEGNFSLAAEYYDRAIEQNRKLFSLSEEFLGSGDKRNFRELLLAAAEVQDRLDESNKAELLRCEAEEYTNLANGKGRQSTAGR